MIQIDELENLVKKYALIFKKNTTIQDGKPMLKKNIDFHDTYLASVNFRDRVIIHAEVGGFPSWLFENRAPNQTQKEFDYIKGNYKQNTLPVYSDYFSTVSRAWSDGNWSIEYGQTDNEEPLERYLENDIRLFGSIENYFKAAITHLRNIDPNGVIAVRPEFIERIETEQGMFVIDSSKMVRPQPFFYRCDQVIYRNSRVGYLILTDEKVSVEYGGSMREIGYVMEFYDDTTVYRITQTGKYIDWNFNIEVFFVHGEGIVPVTELKAIPKLIERELLYMPEFLYACDNLDLALINAQYLQCSIALVCFPYRVMVGGECTFSEYDESNGQYNDCNGGWITRILDDKQVRHQCPACLGSGMKDRVSQVGGVLLLNKEDWTGSGDKAFADKAMYFVSPDVAPLEFTKRKITEDIESARRIMHLHTSTTEVKANPSDTATGQVMDEKAKDAFVKPISDNLFSAFEFTINRIRYQRYGSEYPEPVIQYPNTFNYNTEADYLTQLSEAQKAKLPPFLINHIFLKYLRTLYFTEEKTNNVFFLIVSADRLLSMSSDEANIKETKGTVERWEIILHDSAINLVEQLLMEDDKFFDKDLSEQIAMLQQKAKDLAASIVTTSQLNQQNLISAIVG